MYPSLLRQLEAVRAAAGRTIYLAILDDERMLVEGLCLALKREPGLAVVGTAATCAEGFELVSLTRPDILLLEVDLPDGDGLERIHTLRAACPDTQCLVLTSRMDEGTLLRAVEAGACGFIGKHQSVAEVLAAIRQAAAGEMVMPAALLVSLLSRRQRLAQSEPALPPLEREPLSPLEREVLSLAADGQSSAAIGAGLGLSVPTVRAHLRNALGKLNAQARLEAVSIALRDALLTPASH